MWSVPSGPNSVWIHRRFEYAPRRGGTWCFETQNRQNIQSGVIDLKYIESGYVPEHRVLDLPDLQLKRWMEPYRTSPWHQTVFTGLMKEYRRKQAQIRIKYELGDTETCACDRWIVYDHDYWVVNGRADRIAIYVKELRLSKWRKEARRLIRERRARKLADHIPVAGVVDLVLNYV